MSNVFGLLSPKSEPIPLVGVKVKGDILGRGARVLVFQRFRNNEETAVEAVYKFPLPEGSAICGFKAQVNGRTIQGQVEEREKAFEIYDDALAKGDGGYLLDEERPNIFTLSVGNLNPGTEALIEIEYVTLLDIEGKRIRFFLPTTISPRFIPDEMEDDNGIPVDGKLHPPYAAQVPYGLSIALRIHKGSLLDSVESPSHQVRIENLKGDDINVTLSAESVGMDRDFILYVGYANSQVSRAYRYSTDKESFIQLDFLPDKDLLKKKAKGEKSTRDLKRETVFVIDCSGSMEGDSIHEAKKALEICVRGLEQGNSFNIYRFGSTYLSLWPEPSIYSEKTANQALRYVKKMNADLGGTEILKPLQEICSLSRKDPTSSRDIILLTDGEVGNESEILELIRKNKGKLRVFPVGIGAGCNEYFIKGLARAGSGASAFIYPGERVEPKLIELFGKLNREAITDLAISWDTGSLEQSPTAPAVFMNSPTTIFAKITGVSDEKRSLKLKGNVNGQEVIWEIEIHEVDDRSALIPVLWARERIRDLEESEDALIKGSRQKERKQQQVKEKVVEISKKYGLLSQSTSFIAVEERQEKDRATGELSLRKIPVPVSVGWHGLGSLNPPHADLLMCDLSPDLIPAKLEKEVSLDIDDYNFVDEPISIKEDSLFRLLSLQEPKGGMMLDKKTAHNFAIDFDDLHRTASKITLRAPVSTESTPIDYDLLLSTAIVVTLLEYHFQDERNTWMPVIEKSKRWLLETVHTTGAEVEGRDLLSWAHNYISRLPEPGF